jgi:anti-sigma B factor antagonist
MDPSKQLRIEQVGEITVVQFCESWVHGLQAIEDLGQELYRLVEVENHTRLLLDFSDVEFLSSSALGKLIKLWGKVNACKGTMQLCNLRPQVLEVFLVCKLERLFTICRSRAEALSAS